MSRGINKVIIVGNLGDDPETKYAGNGTAITTISVATSEQWKDKDGEKQERTEWHRIKFFGRLAEIAGEYLKKGRQVYVEGRLQTDKWTDKDGVERYTTNIIGNELQMLGGNPGGSRDAGGYGGGERSEGQRSRSQGHQSRGNDPGEAKNDSARERAREYAAAGAQERPPVQNNAFDDDDIPF